MSHHHPHLLPRRFLVSPFMSRSHHSSTLSAHINNGIFFPFLVVFLAAVVYFFFNYLFDLFFRPYRGQSQQPPDRHDSKREELYLIELRVIPVKMYFAPPQPPDGEDNDTEVENCPVCLGEYVAGEELRVLPICRHTFHRECIDRWLVSKSSSSLSSSSFSSTTSCPVCRRNIVDPEMAAASVAAEKPATDVVAEAETHV